jgi:methionyl-tRNA formyltransferase
VIADTTSIVFAYSEVGARCLSALFDAGIRVPLVVTHQDDPNEHRWFASVAEVARGAGCRVITPTDPAAQTVLTEIEAIRPTFLFSFYYRQMLPESILRLASRGALNMHGSLLPHYRGRAPINWAILHGESETGATLHYMTAKPDAGPVVDQERVPIGPDDTAIEVANRVADAAVTVLLRSLPGLIAGTAPAIPLDLSEGSYFGGRKPQDGEFRLDWSASRIHNLVRAVAPPFPGAYARWGHSLLKVHRTRRLDSPAKHLNLGPCLVLDAGTVIAECGDGARLELIDAYLDDTRLDPTNFSHLLGNGPVVTRPHTET